MAETSLASPRRSEAMAPQRAERASDRDALHILPLSIVPLETRTLARSRMIKNARLESVVELFSGQDTGSGQVLPDDIGKLFNWETPEDHADFHTIRRLSTLPSYDVYSLRIGLRELGVNVDDESQLRLSGEKADELASYMKVFTRPLIAAVYGAKNVDTLADRGDVLALFNNPDVGEVREHLRVLADKLGVSVSEVPAFLEDYGDVYLSVAYYKYCLDEITPDIRSLMKTIKEIRSDPVMRRDAPLMQACQEIEVRIRSATTRIAHMLDSFINNTHDMWEDISALRFRRMEQFILSYNARLGGVLCGINVKMHAWGQAFPEPDAIHTARRAKFLQMEMRPGIERISDSGDD
jgi:hypothetical protein